MDFKLMYRILFNKRNIVALVILVVVFSLGTYGIRQQMHQQYNHDSQSLIHASTKGYQKFLNYYYKSYDRVLETLDYEWNGADNIDTGLRGNMETILEMDSTIVAVGAMLHNQLWEIHEDSLEVPLPDMRSLLQPEDRDGRQSIVLKERYLFVGGDYVRNDSQYARGIIIDLYRLHEKFIRDNIYTSVYQVVINQFQQCIYHPEIEKVGKHYPLPDYLFNNETYNYEQFDTLHLAQSDYLQMPVYIEYSSMPFRGNEWIVLSVSPGFEVKDMIVKQERTMVLLFLFFLSTLLGILMFGILHWKREFLLRSSAEQENLNLLLKHEKQKSETISVKLELLRSGLNSHFMFNSLGTVKALLSKDDEIARKMLSNLSHLYRYQLRTEGEQMVTLRDELGFTQTYVDVINLRMNSSIRLEINNLSDYFESKVLPVSLQLLVENCIKHNIATEKDPLVITIKVTEGRIFVINELRPKVALVETNGKGLNNLNIRYTLITQKECTFKKENGQFIASIPVLN